MYGAQATSSPFGPPRTFTPGTTVGVVALAAGGLTAGALVTREILRRKTAPVLPPLSGEAGALMIGAQDATWSLEGLVGGEPSRWAWAVHSLPAGEFITSSDADFDTPDAARADLTATGAREGWVFG